MTHSVSNLHEAQTVIVGVDTHKLREPVPAAQVLHREACLGLPQEPDDLRFRKSLLHVRSPFPDDRTLNRSATQNGGDVDLADRKTEAAGLASGPATDRPRREKFRCFWEQFFRQFLTFDLWAFVLPLIVWLVFLELLFDSPERPVARRSPRPALSGPRRDDWAARRLERGARPAVAPHGASSRPIRRLEVIPRGLGSAQETGRIDPLRCGIPPI